jgi:hypothetical protein
MNSFENEVMHSFGVKMRSCPRTSDTYPSHPISMKMARPQSMAAYPSPLPLSSMYIRVSAFFNFSSKLYGHPNVYLPSTKGEDRTHLTRMNLLDGSENWQMGYRQCQFMPGNSQWNRGKGKSSKERNFFTKKKTSKPMRRSQSFNQGKT